MSDTDSQKEYRGAWQEIERESWWTLGRVVRFFVLPFFVLGGVLMLLGVIALPFHAAGGIAARTLDPDNILYNYEWFKSTVQEVQAMEVQVGNAQRADSAFRAEAGPKPWDYATSMEVGRLGSVVLGLQNQRQNLVAQYNARAQMANRAIFRTHDLPERLQ